MQSIKCSDVFSVVSTGHLRLQYYFLANLRTDRTLIIFAQHQISRYLSFWIWNILIYHLELIQDVMNLTNFTALDAESSWYQFKHEIKTIKHCLGAKIVNRISRYLSLNRWIMSIINSSYLKFWPIYKKAK